MDRRDFLITAGSLGLVSILSSLDSLAQIGETKLRREIKDLMEKTGYSLNYNVRESANGERRNQRITSENIFDAQIQREDLVTVADYLREEWGEDKDQYTSGSLKGMSLTLFAGEKKISSIKISNRISSYEE